MKKFISALLVLVMFMGTVPAIAADNVAILIVDGEKSVFRDADRGERQLLNVDGTTYIHILWFMIAFDVNAAMINDMNAILIESDAELIDCEKDENIKIFYKNKEIVCTDANGNQVYPVLREGNVPWIPLRAVCENMGMNVSWDQEAQAVSVTTFDEIGGKYYAITNVGTGKKLATVDFNRDNNAKLTTVENDITDDVTWRLGKMGDMKFNLSNAGSGKSIDVPSASRDSGKELITYTSNGGGNQCWNFEEVEEGVYMLRVDHSGLYMDASGDVLVQAEKTDSDYQKWTLRYVKDSMLNKVVTSEGFKLISPELQDGFTRYMFGNLPACYTVANNAESYFIANDFENATPELQAEMIKTVSSYTAYGQVTGDKKDRESAKYEITSVTVDENYDIWRGSREKVWIHSVVMEGDVEGQVHEFVMVTNEENSAMVQKMIEGLGCFPYAVRQYVKRLIWKKGDNANNYNGGGDTIWARLNFEPSANAVIQTFAHELGHILDTNQLEDMRIWSWAEAMDAVPVSSYGSSNQAEDLAEMHRLYWTTLGKDTESAVGEVYPNRLKVLKGLLYRADSVYYADFKVYDDFIKNTKAYIDIYGNELTAKELSIDKYYKITDADTGLVWAIENSSMDNTAKLILEEYTGSDNQLFYVENSAGLVKFYNKNSDIPVQLHTSAMYNKTLTQYGGTWAVDERLELEKVDGGYKMYSKRYTLGVTAVTVGVGENFVPYVGQDAESDVWKIEAVADREGVTRYSITADGKCLAGNPFSFVDNPDGDNTTWMLMEVGEDTFTIVNMGTGKAIDISGGNTASGAKLITYDLSKNDNQLFYMEKVENGYNLKMKHSELYLTVNEDGTITQEEKADDKAQTFVFDVIE